MSRFEPNVEPSMEEILASIRKIIAEDTSGSRVPPSPPASPTLSASRSGPALKSAAAQQRGFMSREAFLRSSEDPAGQRYFTPVTPHDPMPAAKAAPAPKPEIERLDEPVARHTSRDDGEGAAAEIATEAQTVTSKAEPDVRSETAKPDVTEEIAVKAIVEEEQKSLTPEPKSEAAVVETPPVETRADDEHKAQRDADADTFAKTPERRGAISEDSEPAHDAAPAAPASEIVDPEFSPPSEPRLDDRSGFASEAKLNGSALNGSASGPMASSGEKSATAKADDANGNDPFSFDLGPSPFAARMAAEKAAGPKNANGSAPHEAPSRSLSSRNEVTPRSESGWPKVNGAPMSPEPRPSHSRSHEEAPEASSPSRSAAPFAVPSVSATLGPHRTLEPLSEAFKPTPQKSYPQPETPSLDAFRSRDYMRPKDVEPSRAVGDTRLRPEEASLSSDGLGDALAGSDRGMEDAVADLLRPLLKTWLAENMPKIVERALRREITERLLPGHKNSRD